MNAHLIEFPKIHDTRGDLTFVEDWRHVPFDICRVYWMYNIPLGETRAGHAHKALEQVLVAISGAFDVILDDGTTRSKYHLNAPNWGLYVPPLVWREIVGFSSNAVGIAVVSNYYDESDYIRDYDSFLKEITC